MSKNEPSLRITVEGKPYTVKLSEFTGIESKEFRAAVGIPASQVFRDANAVDLDVIAGFVWIIRRRKERGLTYDAVARSLNYETDIDTQVDGVDDNSKPAQDEETQGDDPEA